MEKHQNPEIESKARIPCNADGKRWDQLSKAERESYYAKAEGGESEQ